MVTSELALSEERSGTRESPEFVRISMASAMALRLRSGRFSRDFDFGGVNILLNYEDGCRSGCEYCGLARTREGTQEDKSFIRVEWPLVPIGDLVERMAELEPNLTRLCISMVTRGRAYRDTCEIVRRITERVRTPISVLVAPPSLTRGRLENLKALGVDMIGIGLDAVTEELFCKTRTDVLSGGLKWDNYWDVLGAAREVFGPWKVNVHTVVGLGESDEDLVRLFQVLREREVLSYLFCFNPEPGSRMAERGQPELRRWRRIQLARHLVEAERCDLDVFSFGDDGSIAQVRTPRTTLDHVVADGRAFMTDGCPGEGDTPGCTRPYGSYRPVEAFRDYPFAPNGDDLEEIRRQLQLDDIVAQDGKVV